MAHSLHWKCTEAYQLEKKFFEELAEVDKEVSLSESSKQHSSASVMERWKSDPSEVLEIRNSMMS